MTILIKVKESKDSPEMLINVIDPASIHIDVKHNQVRVLLSSFTKLDIVDNNTGEHYDVIDVDFIVYDAHDELEYFYIYDVINVKF